MFQRQKLWVPAVQHNAAFTESFGKFLTNNPVTSLNMAALNIRPESFFVVLQPDAHNPQKHVAAMLAAQVKVLRPSCDDGSVTGPILPPSTFSPTAAASAPPARLMSFGFATALCDSMNSFHVMLRLLPEFVPHVSVNIKSQLCERTTGQLQEGGDIVVISRIDKMGKRLVYCTTDFYLAPKQLESETIEREASLSTLSDLQVALHSYEKLVHSTHVKSILLSEVMRGK